MGEMFQAIHNNVTTEQRLLMPGDPVTVLKDNGDEIQTYARSAPWISPSGTYLILVVGISGGYALSRVTPRK